MTARSKRPKPGRQTELRRPSPRLRTASRKGAEERESQVFLTAKFERTWNALVRLRAQVGAARFRLVDLPDRVEELRSPDLGAIAEFHDLLGGDHFRDLLAEVSDAFETQSDPGALWSQWIEVVERTLQPESERPNSGR